MSSSAASALLVSVLGVGLVVACATSNPPQAAAPGPDASTRARPTSIATPATSSSHVVAPTDTLREAQIAPPSVMAPRTVGGTAPPAPAPLPVAEPAAAPIQQPSAPEPYRGVPFDLVRAGLAVGNPSGWSSKRQDLALVYAGTMRVPSIVMFEPKARTLDAAVADLSKEVGAVLKGVRINKRAAPTRMAGHAAYVAEGTGSAEGFSMRWRATVVDAAHPTIVLALAPSFFWNANKARILKFEQSITPRKAAR